MPFGDIDRHFAWQAWHLWHWTGFGALGPQWPPVVATAVGVAGVALGSIGRRFAWQAWHLVTSTVTLRGKCGTYGTGLALVARLGRSGRPLSPRLLAWQAWHLVTSTVALRGRPGTECHLVTSTVTLRGRRGTYGTGLALVARLGRSSRPLSPRLLAWQAWHLVLSTVALRGRCGTW